MLKDNAGACAPRCPQDPFEINGFQAALSVGLLDSVGVFGRPFMYCTTAVQLRISRRWTPQYAHILFMSHAIPLWVARFFAIFYIHCDDLFL